MFVITHSKVVQKLVNPQDLSLAIDELVNLFSEPKGNPYKVVVKLGGSFLEVTHW